MDKFYVKPKKNLASSNLSSYTNPTNACRTSSDIFQTVSNGRRLGVGSICSKIRHKIEDNFTPKISGKLYKTGKHSKSLTALSSIGASTGKYTLSNKNLVETEKTSTECRKVKLNSKVGGSNNSAGTHDKHNPYAECYNTSKGTSQFAKLSLHSCVDSDEDETQFSLNVAKTSLEAEIFEELEKVAHDENKLISVLETFDKIIFDYNDPQIQVKSMPNSNGNCIQPKADNIGHTNSLTDGEHDARNGLGLTNENVGATSEQTELEANNCKILEKSLSTLSLTRRKCYQSPDSPCLRQMRHAFAQQQKSKSVWEISNATKIPILKAIPLKTRSKSFCYNNSEDSSMNLKSCKIQKSLTTSKLAKTVSQTKSVPSSSLTNKNQRSRDDTSINKQDKSVVLGSPIKAKSIIKTQSKIASTSKSLQMNNIYCKSKKPTSASNSNSSASTGISLPVPCRNKAGDELLDKCLEKGQQILRKVESLKPQRTQVTSYSRKCVTRAKSNTTNKISKDNLMVKRKQWLQKLNYANEEKIAAAPLESCKIIPPVLGETSDKHAELLVQVANATHLTTNKQRIISESNQLANPQNRISENGLVMKIQESDSDDSGHISNENMEISINHTSNSSSSNSLCEISSASQSSATTTAFMCDNSCSNGVVTKSLKMSEVLEKFERKASERQQSKTSQNYSTPASTNKTKDINSCAQQQHSDDNSKISANTRFCTTCRVADVEAVSVIRTHVEIYPNYSKEVTIRLR